MYRCQIFFSFQSNVVIEEGLAKMFKSDVEKSVKKILDLHQNLFVAWPIFSFPLQFIKICKLLLELFD